MGSSRNKNHCTSVLMSKEKTMGAPYLYKLCILTYNSMSQRPKALNSGEGGVNIIKARSTASHKKTPTRKASVVGEFLKPQAGLWYINELLNLLEFSSKSTIKK